MAGLVTLLQALVEVFVEKIKTNEAKDGTRNIPCLLTDDERKQANEAKERTLQILSDALKKKGSLLVEDPKEFGDKKMISDWPLITTDLVKELIRELEKVIFTKNADPEHDNETNAYVYSRSDDRTIYLCALFWKKDPESKSRQSTIIHEVSHFLGYGHTVQENSDRVQKSPQSMLCPLTTYELAYCLTSFMDHTGTFTNDSYSCCGETSKDTVCEESWMADKLRSVRKSNLKKELLLVQKDVSIKRVKIWLVRLRRQIGKLKNQTNLLMTKNNLAKKSTNLVENQTNLLRKLTSRLKKQASQLKTQKAVETLGDMLETQIAIEKTQNTLMKMLLNLIKMETSLLKVEDDVEKIKSDMLEILADMEETLANVLDQV